MHQAGAVGGGDVVGKDDEVRVGRGGSPIGGDVLGRRPVQQFVGTLVGPQLHLGAQEGFPGEAPPLAEHLLEERLGDDEIVAGRVGGAGTRRRVDALGVGILVGDDVAHVGAHGHCGVGDEGPHQQLGATGQGPRGHRETHVNRGITVVLVALSQLVVGQGGAAAWAVGGDAVVLTQQPLVEALLEPPPHRLDVGRLHRPVGVVHVDPVAHPLGEFAEGVDVTGDRLAALGVEGFDTVLLDVWFSGESQLLLHGELHGESVAVPAGLAVDVVAAHGAVARKDILEHPSLDVVGTRLAIGGGRTLEEGPRLTVLGGLQGLLEGVLAVPQVDDLVLHRGQVHLWWHGSIAAGFGGRLAHRMQSFVSSV